LERSSSFLTALKFEREDSGSHRVGAVETNGTL
jgi:hypothetical protein